MHTMSKSIRDILFDEVLPRVSKPGQYAGGERNAIVKDHASVDLKVALAFHDTYAIGMSHLGLRILYHMPKMVFLTPYSFNFPRR
ncbi:MAG: hypothetical protein L0Z51_02790 [Candidatus Latescibacteria bacterium]|nr:hypothetical protein [Candidatus Latescibacterota bacterium]